ncbi:hypothetical protein BD413DRAFT_580205 [Trametes elegans]|nr:hypothetical protein BD413DRAFT_580205 [Trametes elegans]
MLFAVGIVAMTPAALMCVATDGLSSACTTSAARMKDGPQWFNPANLPPCPLILVGAPDHYLALAYTARRSRGDRDDGSSTFVGRTSTDYPSTRELHPPLPDLFRTRRVYKVVEAASNLIDSTVAL